MRRGILSSIAAGLALVAAGVAVGTAPDSDGITEPFLVHGVTGETVSARLLDVEVSGVSLADTVLVRYRQDTPPITTNGVWVVVDTTVTPHLDTLSLEASELTIGARTYTASTLLPSPSMLRQSYGAEIAQRGALVFEIPSSALDSPGASRATIVFRTTLEPQLDSLPAIVVDLTALTVQDTARIDPVVVVDR